MSDAPPPANAAPPGAFAPPGREPGAVVRVTQPELSQRAALERTRGRLVLAACGFSVLFGAVAFKLAVATVLAPVEPRRITAMTRPIAPAIQAPVLRGTVTDRNGEILAVSLPVNALFANPRQIDNPQQVADQLRRILPQLDRERLIARLSGERQFAYIARALTPREMQAVNDLGVAGLHFEDAERRYFPQGRTAVHVIGGTDVDGQGVAGAERFFDERLRSSLRNEPLRLSVDVRVQLAMRDAVQRAISEFNGIGGAGIVMDVQTSEVIAMVSLPDYDANNVTGATTEQRFNRVTVGVYEPGSTFKLFTAAMALEFGTAQPWSGYDASRPIQYGRFTINDYRGRGRWMALPEILAASSNIASAHMAMAVGPTRHREFMVRMGMASRLRLELPEVAMPIVPSTQAWRDINTMTIGFGHGISPTPMHVVTGVTALVNGGIWRQPTLMAQAQGAPTRDGVRVISERNSDLMRRFMRLVVTDGSGRSADVPGYFVGGKTGTAQKTGPRGGYLADRRIAAFVGAFPMQAPRYALYVMVDEPKPNARSHGFATAGWVAAPAANMVISRIAPILGLLPETERQAEIQASIAMPMNGRIALPSTRPAQAASPAPPARHQPPRRRRAARHRSARRRANRRLTPRPRPTLVRARFRPPARCVRRWCGRATLRLADLMQAAAIPAGAGQTAITAITAITADSRAVVPGALFAALPGTRTDGTGFIAEAVARGAAAILAPEGTAWPVGVEARPMLLSDDPRRALARMAAAFHDAQPRVVVAATGTNGKTSIVDFWRQLWSLDGRRAASIGTLGLIAEGFPSGPSLTTPDPVALHAMLSALAKAGFGGAALEASSHGLEQRRLDGVTLAAAAFANLTRDHLDYHGSMAAYRQAKLRLFDTLLPEGAPAILHADMERETLDALRAICARRRLRRIEVGTAGRELRLMAQHPQTHGQVLEVEAGGIRQQVELALPGRFQADNVLMAAALAIATGLGHALTLAPRLVGVRGRMELAARLPNGAAVYVDYAHTPDALERLLAALRPHAEGDLHVLFGAGGDRDPGKRPLMGEVCARLADHCWITDDNPRGEDPALIRAAIRAACPDAVEIGDRAAAIAAAMSALAPGDVLAVAGKGHESGQTVAGVTLPFDDAAVVRQLAGGRG